MSFSYNDYETLSSFRYITLTNTNINTKLKLSNSFKMCLASEKSSLFLNRKILFLRKHFKNLKIRIELDK